jgi:hypothetical protein
MNNIIERLRAGTGWGKPWMDLHTEAADTIARLQGEAKVMVSLLAGAVAVLQTIEPECATESEDLNQLREGIWAVLSAVAKRGGA